MDDRVGTFIDDFSAAVRLAQAHQPPVEHGGALLARLTEHLGRPAASFPVVVEEVPANRLADLDILMSAVAEQDGGHELLGVGGGDQRHHSSFSDILQQATMYAAFPLGQPDFANVAVGPDTQRQVVALGIWLFSRGGVPLAVMQRGANPRYGRESASLEVLAPHPEASAELLGAVRRSLESQSVIKGQVVSLTPSSYGPSGAGVGFHHRPALDASEVILPGGLLEQVAAHTVGMAAHRGTLAALGQHLKRGILLYGPPGTGKTHTVRYLLGQSSGTTAILLSGNTLAFVAQAAALARAMQPSLVVLEDCDLIAEDRSFGHGPQPLLFEVLEAMDGLDDDADVAFVLTTNRPDLLERALAQRPGRVDLAVEIPLPAEAERRALLALYARTVGFSPQALDRVARRTAGTTASFARELVRRTVLAAALAGQSPADAHLEQAVEDMLDAGQALTRSLLGSGSGG
ncbi:AAA family ATPase [Pseudarthrobacter sp. P1]|uniref:AAA family ATPase n=1 Tax=Pseudarthrobacter sp. P1 TaxID=3418418 RepID=UPI003CEC812A